VKYERRKLDFGDYSFVADGKSYERELVIERKNSINEIIGNFTKGKDRFRREFERAGKCKVILMIEASPDQIDAHDYRSKMSPTKVHSFIKTWCNRFQLELHYVDKAQSCEFILNQFRAFLREQKRREKDVCE
jgi:ERCC4-type nuclease